MNEHICKQLLRAALKLYQRHGKTHNHGQWKSVESYMHILHQWRISPTHNMQWSRNQKYYFWSNSLANICFSHRSYYLSLETLNELFRGLMKYKIARVPV